MQNRMILLRRRPEGIPEVEHFEPVTREIPAMAHGKVLVRNLVLSVEPAMRGWVNAAANYMEPVPIGGVMRSFASGVVVESDAPEYRAGDFVTGMFGWQDYALVSPAQIDRRIEKSRLSASLGILGLTGMAAYFGMLDLGRPKPGDTVVVSTAAGSVGSCAGQLARLAGARTIGIAGGAEKCRQCVEDFGYDAAIDYRSEHDLSHAVAEACPNGVDVYFDNTAGPITDAVLPRLATGARVVICGTASTANWDTVPTGPRLERYILTKRATMSGLLVPAYRSRFPEAIAALERLLDAGKLTYAEDIFDGIEAAPGAIAALYRGENKGKLLVRIADV